jgi:hypothetical protein
LRPVYSTTALPFGRGPIAEIADCRFGDWRLPKITDRRLPFGDRLLNCSVEIGNRQLAIEN